MTHFFEPHIGHSYIPYQDRMVIQTKTKLHDDLILQCGCEIRHGLLSRRWNVIHDMCEYHANKYHKCVKCKWESITDCLTFLVQ